MSDLKQSTRKALLWSALDKGGQQVLLTLVGVVTMRMLGPEVFRVLAPLALYTGVATILTEGGLSAALIRKKEASALDYNTMFWFNLALGVLFYAGLFLIAPWIARYNGVPELTLIARVQFLGTLFFALSLIHSTRIIKRSDFKKLGIANVLSVFLSSATVLAMTLAGCGVWALVGQYLMQAFSRMLILWLMSDFRPRLMFSWRSFGELFGFSSKLIAGSLANNVSKNFYASALGKYLPDVRLGLYERANKIKDTASEFIVYIFGNSIYLMLSQLQDEPARFLPALRKSVRTISFVLFPALFGLLTVAPSLVQVVVGNDWMPAVPYIRILCFSGLFYVLNYFYGNALKARGRSDITLALDIAHAVLVVSFLYLTIRHGLEMALWADVACKLIVFGCYAAVAHRFLGYRVVDQLRDLLPYAGLAAGMAALVWSVGFVIAHPLLLLTVQLTVGGGFYLGVNKVLGSKVLDEVLQVFKRKKA